MRFRTIPATVVVLLLATIAVAQTKVSGTSTCGKPDQQQKIDVGDKPGHAFAISQGKCNWTKPMDLAGIQTKEDVVTTFAEITGAGAQSHGVVVGTMSNGDAMRVRIQGKDAYKDEKLQTSDGTWSFVGGTGKLKGIKGKGTYKGKPDAAGNVVYDIAGEYEIPK